MTSSYRDQIRTVMIIECLIILFACTTAYFFWTNTCESGVISCLRHANLSVAGFLVLSFFRPFVFTPFALFAMMAGNRYDPATGAIIATFGAVGSCIAVYFLAKILGKKLVNPWLRANLPQTLSFVRSQDWKIVLASRLIPLFPFDLLTFLFGLADFRFKRVMLFTFLGTMPEAFIFAKIAEPNATFLGSTLTTLGVVCVCFLLPGFIVEFRSRKKGSGLWLHLLAMGKEIQQELRMNNEIVKRHTHNPKKIPVLLLYGFFSSRRSLTVLERILTNLGYEVFSFNLGGLLGIFFTRSIIDTAQFVDYKLKRQFTRHNFDHIHIVAHSKGGFVALWWLLMLGGHRHCKKLITLGTPYKGSRLTWLALVTPVGLLFRDMWQMRPGSSFLRTLHLTPIPEGVEIYNFYSESDKVAPGEKGILKSQSADIHGKIIPVPMHHVSHFEFLYRRDVGDNLANILGSPWKDLADIPPQN